MDVERRLVWRTLPFAQKMAGELRDAIQLLVSVEDATKALASSYAELCKRSLSQQQESDRTVLQYLETTHECATFTHDQVQAMCSSARQLFAEIQQLHLRLKEARSIAADVNECQGAVGRLEALLRELETEP